MTTTTAVRTSSVSRRPNAFHIAQEQAFVDGNKRTGIAAALFCLQMAGIDTTLPTSDALYDAMIAIANRTLDKPGLAALLRQLFA